MPEATLAVIFFTSFLVGFSGAMAPGPLLTLDIRETTRRGFLAGPLIVLGHAILELALVIIIVKGFGTLLQKGLTTALVGLLGGIFLLWLGWRMISRPIRQPQAEKEQSNAPRGIAGIVVAGALVSLSNPYFLLWWAGVGASYLVWSLKFGALGLSSFYSGHILADLSWYSAVSLGVASGRRIMSDAIYRGISIACGVFLLGLGGYFLYSGISFLK
ncbi:MAG: LysE family transporter [Chloroflexi bacterium]|nr:LysE family transporter [Chloroflexota bacterium]